jgi:arylsulfatase A-like enzyme
MAGADLIMPARFLQAAPLCRLIEQERPTMSGAVPTIWNDILRHCETNAADLSSLRLIACGGSAVPRILMERFQERGVRIVQVYAGGPLGQAMDWDSHTDILAHRQLARESDSAMASLILDLKERGLLQDTMVLIGSEFGRTPVVETGGNSLQSGRDHNPHGFTYLLAGGGFRAGVTYGATDDFGFKAVENPIHVHDLHATMLHLLGLDHEKLTYRYSGRDFRLTDVSGRVIKDLFA